jgi:hypothetical protein
VKSIGLLVAAGALALVAASAGMAQDRGRPGPRGAGFGPGPGLFALQAADADGDRSVTRAELDALAAEEFAWRDHSGDGAIDEGDLSPTMRRLVAQRSENDDAPPRRQRERPGRVDADEDGRVTRDEFLTFQTSFFERLDADTDGVVTPDEMDAGADARRDRGRWWRAP